MRFYYSSLRHHYKTWKPLLHFLLNIIITNCYKLSFYSTDGWLKWSGYKKFLKQLVNSLFELSIQAPQWNRARVSMDQIQWYPAIHHGYKAVRINKKQKTCSACLEVGRRSYIKKLSNRKPLCELSVNIAKRSRDRKEFKRPQRSPRTTYRCRLY